MNSINNRLSKLEQERLEAAISAAKPFQQMTDRELFEALADDQGLACSSDDITALMHRFEQTGELPGNAHIASNTQPTTRREK